MFLENRQRAVWSWSVITPVRRISGLLSNPPHFSLFLSTIMPSCSSGAKNQIIVVTMIRLVPSAGIERYLLMEQEDILQLFFWRIR